MQQRERAQQTFAHIGQHRRRRLAPADNLRFSQIDGRHFGKRAAEIDEDGEWGHKNWSRGFAINDRLSAFRSESRVAHRRLFYRLPFVSVAPARLDLFQALKLFVQFFAPA